jgi:hypothetical protein
VFEAVRAPRGVGFAGDIADLHFADFGAGDGGDPARSDAVIDDPVVPFVLVIVNHPGVVEHAGDLMARQPVTVRMRIVEVPVVHKAEAIPAEPETESHADAGSVEGQANAG